jgi:SAM-dependent methyltransferase
MRPKAPDWYRHAWTLDVQDQSWVEDTGKQVDFLERALNLTGRERILDLACGYGRHALTLARRGYPVVGVDITRAYVDKAAAEAHAEWIPATFCCLDIRDVRFENEFDVVLSMADGAIGYLENDEENLKIFDVVARALKPGGKHFADVCNAAHAERCFPKRWWECGEKSLSLAQFEWDPVTRRMLYGGWSLPYGQPAEKPEITTGDPIRLYGLRELEAIYARRGMRVTAAFSGFDGKPADDRQLQLMVVAEKR